MSQRTFSVSRAIGALLLIVLWSAVWSRDAAAQDPNAFIASLGTKAIQVLGPGVPPPQRVARFRELFQQDFDGPGIGQFVLGRYWRAATPQQQQEFLTLFQEYVVQAYAGRLGEYGGEQLRVLGSRPNGDEIVVSTEVPRPTGNRIIIDWYVINHGGRLKITDVYLAWVSMKVTQRDEFASVIQQDGGRIDGLLAKLRQKTAAAR